jgi:hypothetical protein
MIKLRVGCGQQVPFNPEIDFVYFGPHSYVPGLHRGVLYPRDRRAHNGDKRWYHNWPRVPKGHFGIDEISDDEPCSGPHPLMSRSCLKNERAKIKNLAVDLDFMPPLMRNNSRA